jgi:predicted transcriptional regulator
MAMSSKKSIIKHGLTNKQRILHTVQRWDDDISLEEVAYRLNVLGGIMEGLADEQAGRVYDFDEVFDELERLDHAEENKSGPVAKGKKGSSRVAPKNHRRGNPKDGNGVHKPAQGVNGPIT